jgi:hypothetical protein
MLGDRGTVLPRIAHGSPRFPAQGWYAEIDGKVRFMGDHAGLAAAWITKLDG